MDKDMIEGQVKNGAGVAESLAGEALGDADLQGRGDALRVEGRLQDAVGAVHEAVDKAAGRVKVAASAIHKEASEVYGRVTRTAEDVAARVDPFVAQQPYAALGLAVASGFLAGLLLASRGPRVIYVKSRA
jgi:ElaB/YqjD/DUF883 family membrane-anchored ribosome-binding protein